MKTSAFLSRSALAALAIGIASPVMAQVGTTDPQPETIGQAVIDEQDGPDIVVTGSLIRGTPEDSALPVDVISSEELARQGSPSVVDLLKNLPVSNGVVGDANQFDSRSQGQEGIATVNLRGLGPARTLVLLNGKRIVNAGIGVPAVDINLIPVGAIGRVEILKDGAAATYGSDAIAGVINFITRDRQDGFLVSGDYRYIRGSDGDYGGNVSYGHSQDGFRVLVSAGYQHRSELQTIDRDFAVQPYANNPQGGFTGGGNPGNFDFNATVGGVAFVRDLGCEAVGGFRSIAGSTTDRCFTNFGQFDSLIEPEDRYQAYIETEIDLADNASLTLTALYGRSDTVITTSPSYLPTLPPSANAVNGGAGLFQIPTYSPALRDYCAVFGAAAGCLVGATGTPLAPAFAFPVLFRPALLGGNPDYLPGGSDKFANERGSARSPRSSESIRFTADLAIELSDSINLDTAFTYSQYIRSNTGRDTFGDLLQNALSGFGGTNCAFSSAASRVGLSATQLAALAGTNGCQFFNPFSTAIQMNPVTGQVNPNFAGTRNPTGLSTAPGAGLVNDPAIYDYFFQDGRSITETEQFVGDVVLGGGSGLSLPGGEVGFAIGGQYRRNYFAIEYNNVSNLAVNPCPGSPLNPAATCNPQTGALGFLGTNADRRTTDDVYAVFGELQIPVFDALNIQLSARYEDYGGGVGSTFDPQARVRFQVTDWLALRGGVGTTFRGPPAQFLGGNVTSLQVIGSSFRAIDVTGNPNLTPESATTYNAGILVNAGPFTGSVDYFRYDFSDSLQGEPVSGIVNSLFGASGAANCGNPAFADLQARFTFTGAGCNVGNVQRLRTNIVNGSDVRTSGIDFQGQFKFDVSGFELGLGVTGTYVIDYRIEDVTVEGIVVQPSFDAVGLLNFQTTAYPLPQWKGNAFIEALSGGHSARLQYNYVDGYTDQRGAAIFGPNTGSLAGASTTAGKEIGSYGTLDFTYRVTIETGTTIALSALNILNKEPPFARLDFNYDPFTASPLGFNAKVSLSQSF